MIVKSGVTLQFTPPVMRKRTHLCSDISIQMNANLLSKQRLRGRKIKKKRITNMSIRLIFGRAIT